jgi:hypothetical protein
MPAGRPLIPFDQTIATEICERIVESRMGLEHVLDVMRSEPEWSKTPTLVTIYRWMTENDGFFKDSARARQLSADTYVDAAVNEAHTQRIGKIEGTKETKDGTFAESKIVDNVQRSQLIVQTLLKRAGQLNPKKYGERLDLNHGGTVGVNLVNDIPRPDR